MKHNKIRGGEKGKEEENKKWSKTDSQEQQVNGSNHDDDVLLLEYLFMPFSPLFDTTIRFIYDVHARGSSG